MSSLTPLSMSPVRRRPQPAGREAQAPAQVIHDAVPKRSIDARAVAAQIVAAGARRRGEIPEGGAGLTGLAAQIVATAALVRSGGPPPPLPPHPVARAIILSGLRARGMIDAAGARELDDYLKMLEAREVSR
jgi:hypothetical protein